MMLPTKMKYHFIISVLIFVLCSNSIFAQQKVHKRALKFQDLALSHFRQGDTTSARRLAIKAIEKDAFYATPWVLLGNIFELQMKNVAALDAYKRALMIDEAQFSELYSVVAELELNLKSWDSCILHIQKYLSINEVNPDERASAIKLMETAKFRRNAYENPIDFKLMNLGESINSDQDEYVNSLSTDEQSLYITIKSQSDDVEHGKKRFQENIFQSKMNSLGWLKPRILKFDDEVMQGIGGASISPNNRYLFFTSCQDGCDLYYAKISDGKLGPPRSLGTVVNSNNWDSQACFSADGKNLFFASKRAGGYGGSDIWISSLDETGRFQQPINAGAVINTSGDEMSPLIHYDTKTLYFSSNGHIGLGSFDLFMSHRIKDNDWTEPKNLGYPINTEKDEINLIVAPDGISAYVSADQLEGYGGFDIYKFDLNEELRPNPVTYVKGIVYDSETLEKLKAKVELGILPSGEIFTQSESEDGNGVFLVALPLNNSISLNVEKDGYLMYSAHFSTSDIGSKASPVQMQIPLKKISFGANVVLNNIFFETNEFELMRASYPELNKLVTHLKENPEMVIEISGHTDDVGSFEYNQELSEKRAQSVFDYLKEKGVNTNRISFKGCGESKPMASNETEEGRANNRRIEFKIIDLKY